MKRVVVTGSSGKVGRATIAELSEGGYEVLGVDLLRGPATHADAIVADLTEMGQVVELLAGADAVVHHAAIPAPGIRTEEMTFRTNMMSTFNVFEAAAVLGIGRVVWASSEMTLGLPFGPRLPDYAPVDEDHTLYPEQSYALAKVLCEEVGRQYHRRFGTTVVALRFSNVIEPADYERFPSYWPDSKLRCWNLWGYIDVRDAARSARLALEAEISGAHSLIIAAADTVMDRPSADLMKEVYPSVPLRPLDDPYATLLSIRRAREVLGYEPAYSWRGILG
jgi:nucleoside-diphosphate-sugar epimerase